MDLQEYARSLEESEAGFRAAMAKHGLPFEEEESAPRERRARVAEACGAQCENGGASVWRNWISPACLACRTGEGTGSLFVDLRCTKNCYFCFNKNQPHYDHFRTHERDIVLELEQAHAAGAQYRCLAVTGGEPLLYKDRVTAFFRRASELYPGVHTRLYTNGDLADAETLAALAEAGLREVRFSVKPPDFDDGQERVFAAIEAAVAAVPDVVIEMPVIPGSVEWMKDLLRRADALGVRGINLLEFCFPLHSAEEFRARGLGLRRRPYRFLYDYWYSGGVPVARSEACAFELMEFAAAEGLALGVHYCSADNRNSAQVSLQNSAFAADGDLARAYPWMALDDDDHFLKCAKAFGGDVDAVCAWAERAGVPCWRNDAVPSVAIPLACFADARIACPDAAFGVSVNILEEEDGAYLMREVGVEEAG